MQTNKIVYFNDERNSAVAHDCTAGETLSLDIILGEILWERLNYNLLFADKFVSKKTYTSVICFNKKNNTLFKVLDFCLEIKLIVKS